MRDTKIKKNITCLPKINTREKNHQIEHDSHGDTDEH